MRFNTSLRKVAAKAIMLWHRKPEQCQTAEDANQFIPDAIGNHFSKVRFSYWQQALAGQQAAFFTQQEFALALSAYALAPKAPTESVTAASANRITFFMCYSFTLFDLIDYLQQALAGQQAAFWTQQELAFALSAYALAPKAPTDNVIAAIAKRTTFFI